jgi:S1-C subfamily serine protease
MEKLPSVIKKVKDNVCRIVASYEHELENIDCNELSSYMPIMHLLQVGSGGTGFLINSGYVITALHVVKGYPEILAITSSKERIKLDLVKKDDKSDLALLKPEKRWCEGIDVRSVAEPHMGSLVFTLGYPLGYICGDPILSVGFLSNVVLDESGVEYLVVNAAFNVGNSGGPLINEDGLFLGVVKAKGILRSPLLKLADKIMEKPGVELVYSSIKVGELEWEITLSKIIRALMKWIEDNIQTNIGYAISGKHVVEITKELK